MSDQERAREEIARVLAYHDALREGFSDPEARDIAYQSTDAWMEWSDHADAILALRSPADEGLREFGKAVLRLAWDDFCDGRFEIEVQSLIDAATEAGLASKGIFDPAVDDDATGAAQAGDDFWTLTPAARTALGGPHD